MIAARSCVSSRNTLRDAEGTLARFGRVVSYGRGGCAAVNEEKSARVKRGHQLPHQCRIGSRERPLMIVDADGVRYRFKHPVERRLHLLRIHPHAQFDWLGIRILLLRLHRQMQNHLIAAAKRFLRDGPRKRQMRNHGDGQRKRELQEFVRRGAIVAKIVEDDCEFRPRARAVWRRRWRTQAGDGAASQRKRRSCASRSTRS